MTIVNMEDIFFFDTYAFFEVINGNPKYEVYTKFQVVTTIFNLAELNYGLKKKMNKEKSDNYTEEYYRYLVDVSLEDIKMAMDFKTINKHLSIPDAIGYTVAKRLGVKFLTGDNDFKDMENVEFVR